MTPEGRSTMFIKTTTRNCKNNFGIQITNEQELMQFASSQDEDMDGEDTEIDEEEFNQRKIEALRKTSSVSLC